MLVPAVLVMACSRDRLEPGSYHGRGNGGEVVEDTVDVPDHSLVMCGVEYPQGYDWKRDSLMGMVQGKVFLSDLDGILMERRAGVGTDVSLDEDMHRIVDGALWEDWSTGSETVVRRDGVEVLRWDGREMVTDLVIRDSAVFALTVPRSGGGFVLRRDGDVVARSDEYYPVSPFYEDGAALCFNARSDDGLWAVVRDGQIVQAEVDCGKIVQVYSIDNESIVACLTEDGLVCLSDGRLLLEDRYISPDAVYFTYDGTDLYVEAQSSFGFMSSYKCWRGSELIVNELNVRRLASCVSGGHFYALCQNVQQRSLAIFSDSGPVYVPAGYVSATRPVIVAWKEHFYVSLLGPDGIPAILADHTIYDFHFNGRFDDLACVARK